MKVAVVFLFALLAACAVAEESKVVVLTDADFHSKIADGKTWFIKMYAPWCGHCKKLAPTWEEFAVAMSGDENMHVAEVDCTTSGQSCKEFGVRGYPTVKLLRDGKQYAYKGARTVDAFKAFYESGYATAEVSDIPVAGAAPAAEKKEAQKEPVKKPANKPADAPAAEVPSAVVSLNVENFDAKIAEGKWIVKFFSPSCPHCKSIAPKFAELSNKLPEGFHAGEVDCTAARAVCTRFAIRGVPSVKVLDNGNMYNYEGDRSVENMKAFTEGAYLKATPAPIPLKAKEDL